MHCAGRRKPLDAPFLPGQNGSQQRDQTFKEYKKAKSELLHHHMKRIDFQVAMLLSVFQCLTPLTRHTAGGGGRIFNNRLTICLGHCVLLFA